METKCITDLPNAAFTAFRSVYKTTKRRNIGDRMETENWEGDKEKGESKEGNKDRMEK
jgi:hypothetical protein